MELGTREKVVGLWRCVLMVLHLNAGKIPVICFWCYFYNERAIRGSLENADFIHLFFLSLGCLEVCSTAYIFCLSFLFISFEHMNVKQAKTAAVCCLKSLCRISEQKL